MSKALVDREVLESLGRLTKALGIGWEDANATIRSSLAQPAEAEGVEAVEFWVLFDATTPEPYIKKMMPEGVLAFFDHEEDAIRAKSFHPGTDYKRVPYVRQSDHLAALSAVTAERDRLRELVNSANGFQDALERERDQLRAEVGALKADAERYRWTSIEGNWVARAFGKWRAHTGDAQRTAWFPSRGEAIDAAMAEKEE